jgi:WD40 repeat protein
VIDISEATASVLAEVDILKTLQAPPRTLCLTRNSPSPHIDLPVESAMHDALPVSDRVTVIRYDQSRLPGIIRRLLLATLFSLVAAPFIALLIAATVRDKAGTWTIVAGAAASLALGITFAVATSTARGYSRRSAARIRAAIRAAYADASHAPPVLWEWREHLRVFSALLIPLMATWILLAWNDISSDLDTLKHEAADGRSARSTAAALGAHHRLAKIPLLRSRIDLWLAANLARRSESENDIQAKLAFALASLSTAPNAGLRHTVDLLLEKPFPRALAMTYGHMGLVHSISMNRDETLLVVGGAESINIDDRDDFTEYEPAARAWVVQSGNPASRAFLLPKVRNDQDYYADAAAVEAALSPDGSYFVIADTSRVVVAALEGSYTKDLPGAALRKIAISPDSSMFVVANTPGAKPGRLRVVDRFGNSLSDLPLPELGPLTDLQFARSSNRLLAVGRDAVAWMSAPAGKVLALHSMAADELIQAALVTRDDQIVLVSTTTKDENSFSESYTSVSKVQLLRSNDLRSTGPAIEQKGIIRGLVASPDAALMAWAGITCCRNSRPEFSTLELWRTRERTRVCSISTEDDPPTSIAFSPDSRHVAVTGDFQMWERSATDCEQIGQPLDIRAAKIVTYMRDGKHLLTIDQGAVRLLRAAYFDGSGSLISPNEPQRALETWLKISALKFDDSGDLVARF